MKRSINRLLCILLSVLMSVTAFSIVVSAQPTPLCIQYRSLNECVGAAGAAALTEVSPETQNFLEGTGALKWNSPSGGNALFWFIYCQNTDGLGTDITGTSFITFDIYINDISKWNFSASGDKRITVTNKTGPDWNSEAGETNSTDTAAMMSSWKTGWNHVVIPFTPGADAQHAFALRMFTTDSSAQAGFYTIIDDISFVNQEYLDSQEYTDKIAAKDVSVLINSIGTVTKDSGAAIDAARSAYNTLSETQKTAVVKYSALTAAEAAYKSFSPLSVKYHSFDECTNLGKDAAFTSVESEKNNFLEGTGAVKWSAAAASGDLFWYIYCQETDGLGTDITGTNFITFDIYISDASKWHFNDTGDKRITIANENTVDTWNSAAGEANNSDTAAMMSSWKTGWNHVVIPFTPGADTQHAFAIRMFTTNSTTEAGFYTIIDDFQFVNQKYLDSQEYADIIAAKDVSVLINSIGTVTKDSGAAIEAARSAYNNLTETQKTAVAKYSTLTAAETTYAGLTADSLNIQYRSFDDASGVNQGGALNGTAPETVNYVEGTGAVKWSVASSGTSLFWFIYCADMNGNGTDISGTSFITFDIYINDITKFHPSSDGDKRITVTNTGAEWNNTSGETNGADTFAMMSSWKTGWNHVVIPYTPGADTKHAFALRMFTTNSSADAGFYTIIDDVQFVNQKYLDSQEYTDKIAAKDVSALINAIGTVTEQSGAVITTARSAYDALSNTQKNLVATYPVLTIAENTFDSLTSVALCVKYRTLDDPDGINKEGAFTVVLPEYDNYIEGTGACRWEASENGTSAFWFIYNSDMESNGTDISGTSYITFDIYINDITKWHFSEAGDKRITITNRSAPEWNIAAGETNNTDTAIMMSSWETGWNHVVIPYTPGTDTENAYALRMFTTNSTIDAGFYTIIDDVCFVNQKYLDSQEYADKIAAKDVSALINGIGTVTKDSGAVIETARSAYDGLTADQKPLVVNYNILRDAESSYANFAIAQAVIDKINLIGTVTKDSGALITDASTSYDALNSAQKKLVNNLDTLTAAEAAFANIQAAEDVIAKINAIGTVTKDSGTLIKTARDAYDLLTQAQKDLATNYQTLIDAEKAFAELIVYGDINSDGKITAADALLALQSSVKKVVLTEAQQTAADVDGKDGVTAADALLILQYSVEKISSFPVEKKD